MRRRRGFILIWLTLTIVLGFGFLWLIAQQVTDSMYLLRIAAAHANRVSTMESLVERINLDALAATAVAERDGGIDFRSGAQIIASYRIEDAQVTREADGRPAMVWSARRLAFAWEQSAQPGGVLLTIVFRELPPPRATLLAPRVMRVPLLVQSARQEAGS